MKAVFYTKYGRAEVFQVKEVEKPSPKSDEVLVKVMATTVNRTDTGMTSAEYIVSRVITGLVRPKKNIPGTDFAGVVEAIGDGVSNFEIGDKVFGFNDEILSSQAEYMCIKSSGGIVPMPADTTFAVAAASIEGAHYALNSLRSAKLKQGQRVLVNGASGSIGTAAVQLIKNKGCYVDAVCGTKNIDLVKSLGAEKVFDYQQEDFTKKNMKYDLVLDAVGKSSFFKCKRLLKANGIYISSELGKYGANIWLALLKPFIGSRKVHFPIPQKIKESLKVISELLTNKKYKPVIEKSFSMAEVVDAYTYVASGEKTGNVILNIGGVQVDSVS